MVGHCFNPECRDELRYLRQGSFYAWDSGVAPERSEFLWLCSACSRAFLIACDERGRPVIWPKWLRIVPYARYSRVRGVQGRRKRRYVSTDGGRARFQT